MPASAMRPVAFEITSSCKCYVQPCACLGLLGKNAPFERLACTRTYPVQVAMLRDGAAAAAREAAAMASQLESAQAQLAAPSSIPEPSAAGAEAASTRRASNSSSGHDAAAGAVGGASSASDSKRSSNGSQARSADGLHDGIEKEQDVAKLQRAVASLRAAEAQTVGELSRCERCALCTLRRNGKQCVTRKSSAVRTHCRRI